MNMSSNFTSQVNIYAYFLVMRETQDCQHILLLSKREICRKSIIYCQKGDVFEHRDVNGAVNIKDVVVFSTNTHDSLLKDGKYHVVRRHRGR